MDRMRRQRDPLSRDAIRVLRWHLVHAAGCVDIDCAAVQCYRVEPHELEWSDEEREQLRRVRIPRSLRARLAAAVNAKTPPQPKP
jgi:hypothetical protein